MSRALPLTLLVPGILALGCGHRPKEGEAITDVCVLANDGKEVSASGYLAYTSTTYCDHDGCPFFVTPKPNAERDDQSIRVSFQEGKKPRQVEVLKRTSFSKDDIVFHDDNDIKVALGDVVRVTGKVSVKAVGDIITCTMFRPKGVQKL
jgi:hypothetical protein